MDIRNVSEAEKMAFIHKAMNVFAQIRNMLDTLEMDIHNEDLMIQASAVWISGNLANWYFDFMEQIRAIHHQKEEIQKQIMEADKENEKSE